MTRSAILEEAKSMVRRAGRGYDGGRGRAGCVRHYEHIPKDSSKLLLLIMALC